MRFRNICFTINNYTKADISRIQWLYANGDASYIVYGKEVGDSGTPHLQGYMEFSKQVDHKKLAQLMPRARTAERKATAEVAAAYCKKGEQSHEEWEKHRTEGPNYGLNADVYEVGVISQQGKRTDIDEPVSFLQSGGTMRQLVNKYPAQFVKYHKGFEKLRQYNIGDREEVPEVIVIVGKTGVGKSKMAREMLKDPYVWSPQNKHWFDGYDGHEHVLFEEFRGQLPFGMLLTLLDRYSTTVEVKGGINKFIASKIVMTSPKHPIQWYEALDERVEGSIDQLMRRITKIITLD